jgi:hypothetical protein
MQSSYSLFDRIRASEIELGELHWLLLQRFKGAMQPTPDEVVYPGHPTQYSVKICLGKVGIKDVLQGPNLDTADIDSLQSQIISELLAPIETRIANVILFSHLPVDGWYRYRDCFQILPIADTAPRPTFLLADHPFVLQFRFPTSSNWSIRNFRRSARQGQLVSVLGALLAGSVWSLSETGDHRWTVLSDEVGIPLRTEYLPVGYICPGFVAESDEFSAVDGLRNLPRRSHHEYFFSWGLSGESCFEVPESLDGLLDGFYNLPADHREQFLRASYWFELARTHYTSSRSATFAALISSIETLMPSKEKSSACKECGQSLGKSTTQRFVDFVEQMAPSADGIAKARKELYRVRSTLLHGGRLLDSDRVGICPALGLASEFENMNYAQRLGRLVLANWLAATSGILIA